MEPISRFLTFASNDLYMYISKELLSIEFMEKAKDEGLILHFGSAFQYSNTWFVKASSHKNGKTLLAAVKVKERMGV